MTVVEILPRIACGGVCSIVTDLSIELAKKKNVTVHLIILRKNRNNTHENSIIHNLKKSDVHCYFIAKNNCSNFELILQTVLKIRRLVLELRKNNEKIIVNMHLKLGTLIGVLSTLFLSRVVRIETYHSNYKKYFIQISCLKHFTECFIAVSKNAEWELKFKYKIKKSKIEQIYNGFDLKGMKTIMHKQSKQREFRGINILSCGSLIYYKGFEYSVIAYRKFSENVANTVYRIYGEGPEKPILSKISKSSNVLIYDPIKRGQLLSVIGSSDVVVIPSLFEGHSIFLLEVVSLKIPIIISDIESFREFFGIDRLKKNEKMRLFEFGILVKPKSVESIYLALSLFNDNKSIFKSIKNTYENKNCFLKYDIRNTVSEYLSVFRKTQKSKGSS